ncbi:MAG: hypothetical protein ACRD28_07865, partial [Acidobacteriaceae bacterium]
MGFTLSRRTCMQWLLSLLGTKAFAQQLPAAYQAASSDPSEVVEELSTRNLWLGLSSHGHVLRIKLGSTQVEEPVRMCTVLT